MSNIRKACIFCNIDYKDVSNTIIEETDSFIVVPSKGALVVGYLLILPKMHVTSLNELEDLHKLELFNLMKKYREVFYDKFNKYPIIFEHGTSEQDSKQSSSSVNHAHLHIVNHNFKNEYQIINALNLEKVDMKSFYKDIKKSYISYISPNFNFYITHDLKGVSQQMRIYISEDLNIQDKYNWKNYNFRENIIKTIDIIKQ